MLRDTDYNLREKIFINIAWLPKATVQVRVLCYFQKIYNIITNVLMKHLKHNSYTYIWQKIHRVPNNF